jgi:hypothetical protein
LTQTNETCFTPHSVRQIFPPSISRGRGAAATLTPTLKDHVSANATSSRGCLSARGGETDVVRGSSLLSTGTALIHLLLVQARHSGLLLGSQMLASRSSTRVNLHACRACNGRSIRNQDQDRCSELISPGRFVGGLACPPPNNHRWTPHSPAVIRHPPPPSRR